MKKLSKALAASLVILIAFAGLAIEFNTIAAKEKLPGYWETTLPMNYHAKDQLWFFYFTDFESKKLHWSTAIGPPDSPTTLAVTFDVDYVKTTGSKLGAWDENPWLDLYAEALRLKLGPAGSSGVWVEVAADKATLDFDFHDPDAQGVVGTLIGHLTGKVKVYVNPGLPIPPPIPAYENSEFTFKWTFVEPNYTVELSKYDMELPIGEPKTVTVTVKNTTKLSDMVWLQVDLEDLKKKDVGVDVQYDHSNFLPTTEGVTRDVTITAFADPMKQELPITGTIRISVDGNMMFGWPYEDRAHADLTVTVPKPYILELKDEIVIYDTHHYRSPGWPGPAPWPYFWGAGEKIRGYYVFNVNLDDIPLDGETYTFRYTVHHIYKMRWSPTEAWSTVYDKFVTYMVVGTPPGKEFSVQTHGYQDWLDYGSFSEEWYLSELPLEEVHSCYITEASIEFRGVTGHASYISPPTPRLHVENIDMSCGLWFGRATILVTDNQGNAVEGATVMGCWSGLTSDIEGAVTGSDGKVTVTSDYLYGPPTPGSFYVFTVYEIAKPACRYDPSDNTETQDSIEALT